MNLQILEQSSSLLLGLLFLLSVISVIFWRFGTLEQRLRSSYGFQNRDETYKFSLLAICFGTIVSAYLMLRTVKDPIFYKLVGREYVPIAKFITPFLLLIVLAVLNLLINRVPKHRLFLIFSGFYSTLLLLISLFWKFQFDNKAFWIASLIPGSLLGWATYFTIDSLGVVIIGGIFWAFVNSSTTTESAKKGYILITVGGQLGNLIGPAFNLTFARKIGNENVLLVAAFLIMLIPVVMEFYIRNVPSYLQQSDDHVKINKKTGILEGVRLVLSIPFLMGIAFVSTVYEVISQIIDLQFKFLCSDFYTEESFTVFTSFHSICTSILAILFTVYGTSYLIKKIGVKYCLISYPICIGIVVFFLWLTPSLWSFFIGMLVIKGLGYSMNSPVKELLYLPTSQDIKMKAKGFIDSFGGKGAKGLGAIISNYLVSDLALLLNVGGIVTIFIVCSWVVIAILVGDKYYKLVNNKEIVG